MYAWGRGRRRERASIPRRAKRGKHICHRKESMFTSQTYGYFLFKYVEAHRKLLDIQRHKDTGTHMHVRKHTNKHQLTQDIQGPNHSMFLLNIYFHIQEEGYHTTQTQYLHQGIHPGEIEGSLQTSLVPILCVYMYAMSNQFIDVQIHAVTLTQFTGLTFMQIQIFSRLAMDLIKTNIFPFFFQETSTWTYHTKYLGLKLNQQKKKPFFIF